MAVTVADVLAMPVLEAGEPALLAGEESLERDVRWVHSAELADISHLLRGGELVLTTGIALPDDPAGLDAYVSSLQAAGAVGLVVELGQRWTCGLPEVLVEACRYHDLVLVSLSREVRYVEVTQTVGERIVDERLFELRAVERVHERFTELSVAGAAPSEILAEASRMAGCPVVLESYHHQVLGYEAGTVSAPDLLGEWERRSRAVATRRRTFFDEDTGWLVTVVGARGDDWGRLVLVAGEQPPYRDVVLAEQAAAALALHRLHSRDRDSVERQAHSALLAALAGGDVSDELLARCDGAGVPLSGRRLVALAARPVLTGSEPSAAHEQGLAGLAAVATDAARSCEVPALIAVVDDSVWLLVSHPPRRRSEAVVDQLAREVHRLGPVVVALGGSTEEVGDVRRILAEARHVVGATHHQPDGRLVHRLEDVHVRGLVHLLGEDERLAVFVQREVGALLRHEERHGDGLVQAVRALLAHPANKAAAAASMHLSRAAFYERITKAEHVLGVDLADGEVRTAVHLALLVRDLG